MLQSRCRTLAAGVGLTVLALCLATAPAYAETCDRKPVPKITAVTVPLDPDNPERAEIGGLRYRGGIWLKHDAPKFGGFSGMWVSADGETIKAVSDGGYWLDGTLSYDGSGNLVGFKLSCFAELIDENGKVSGWWEDRDAEALTFDGQKFLVGFEQELRIWSYADFTGSATNVPLPKDFSTGVPPGGGYSSIASDSPGTFFLLTEFARNEQRDVKGFVQTKSGSGVIWLAARDEKKHLPVDWAVMPGGDLVLAEIAREKGKRRGRFHRLRLSRVARADLLPGQRVVPKTIAELEPPMIREKYEGVAARKGVKGETLIYIMSDSDGRKAERTVIRMFELMPR